MVVFKSTLGITDPLVKILFELGIKVLAHPVFVFIYKKS